MKVKQQNEIILKIHELEQKYPEIHECLVWNPCIKVRREKDGWGIDSIEFCAWKSALIVTEDAMTFLPDNGISRTLFRYNGWNEFLNLNNEETF